MRDLSLDFFMAAKALSDIRRKFIVLNYAKETGNVSKACRFIMVYQEKLTINRNKYIKNEEQAFVNLKYYPYNLTI